MKLWQGRTSGELNKAAADFNSSLNVDKRLWRQDIKGSIAHATMLGDCGIISKEDADLIKCNLQDIYLDIENRALLVAGDFEDIHSFVEAELTNRIGDVGKRLHTARSRNDQVATDLRLYLKEKNADISTLLKDLIGVLTNQAEYSKDYIAPSYTHLQIAQPIAFGHHLMAYCEMFLRDIDRLKDCKKRTDCNPLGACALAGTSYPINRLQTTDLLDFNETCHNSLDAVSDRDFVIELQSVLAQIAMHLSRFSEEICIWASTEFAFITLDDGFSTGSSIMPQKKNPDIAELVRGKTGRIYGNLLNSLTLMKSLPLAYNKDMQEDKHAIFDSIDNIESALLAFIPMIDTMQINRENLENAAKKGFINATDCADYLVKKGMPFRDAYKIVGELVSDCVGRKIALDSLEIADFKAKSNLFEDDIYDAINLKNCAKARNSYGGGSPEQVERQIERVRKILKSK